MITVNGDINATYQLLYGGVTDSAINNVQQRINSLATAGLGLTNNFINSTRELFNSVGSHDVIRAARRAVAGVATFATGDTLQALRTLEEFQLARNHQRNLMAADPWIRKKIHDLEIDGWSEAYVDPQPGVIGLHHHEYRLLHDGQLVLDEENKTWELTQFRNHLKKGEEPVNTSQQFDVRVSVSRFRQHYLTGDVDPSSIFGEDL